MPRVCPLPIVNDAANGNHITSGWSDLLPETPATEIVSNRDLVASSK